MRGMGVLLNDLYSCGADISEYLNKKIDTCSMESNEIHIRFADGKGIAIFDNGQSCCENRYMKTDYTLSDLNGSILTNIEIKDGPNGSSEYGEHEVNFLEITTDNGHATISNHNEHNGYYGGFSMTIKEI